MDVQRAHEILESNQQIDVTFEGESVWIDELNPEQETAMVHSMNSGKSLQVEVDRLHEPQ